MAQAAQERVVTLMTPSEKAVLDARALGVSTGEMVQCSVAAYDPEAMDQAEEIEALLAVPQQSSREALKALDEAMAELAETRRQLSRDGEAA